MSDHKTEEHVLAVVLEERSTHNQADGSVVRLVVPKVVVDGKQIGLISNLSFSTTLDGDTEMTVEFLKGASPEVVEGLSEKLQDTIKQNVSALRQFAFVTVKSPVEP